MKEVENHELLGKKYEDIKDQVRLVKVDGEGYFLTMDWNPTRLNVEVEDGIVVKVYYG